MSLNLGVVMDPIAQIKPYKDTTLALLLAAQDKGWNLFYMEPGDLALKEGRVVSRMQTLKVFDDNDHWFELDSDTEHPLSSLDVILMRKDPPFDNEYIYATYLLEQAEREGVLVVNKPQSLRDCNEKMFATQFPQCCPPLVVTSSADQLRGFYSEHGDIVMKPLDGMGGASIFRVGPSDPNLGVIIETLTQHGKQTIMAQKYLPEIKQGDKRILVIDGEAVPYSLARIPASGETRGNLAAGGRGEPQPLSERDRWIVSQVAETLVEKGLLFVGLDVIGDYLTEINVTSPTCAREIDAAFDTKIGERLMNCIEKKLA